MIDSGQILGGISVLIAIGGTIPYIISMMRGTTRPHIFSWFLWGTFNAIAGIAQITDGGGPGAWVNIISALMCWLVAVMGLLQKGERDLARSDWYCLIGAFVAMLPWALANDPLWSVVIITVIDMMAFYPTIRKGWKKPYEEHILFYGLSAIKHSIGLMALSHYSLTTTLFSASIVLSTSSFIVMILYRRKKLA